MRFTITISPTYNQMNLQEDIDRIKEVMGINEGFLNTFLRRVVFSATRDFVHDEIGGEYHGQLELRDKLEPQIFEYIKNNKGIYNDIYDHYISNIG